MLAWAAVLCFMSVSAAPSRASGQPADPDRTRATADSARGFRLVISVDDRRLWAIIGADTLLSAPVAVASGSSLEYQGRRWKFETPRGRRRVLAKDSVPEWVPPEWHYYEVARARGLVVRNLVAGQPVELADGRQLDIRGAAVGIVGRDSVFTSIAASVEIIFDGVIFIPPLGTSNRRIPGELGAYRIDLGGGYMLHGTRDRASIGQASTHGCIRLGDADIAWLYEFVPIGAHVFIY